MYIESTYGILACYCFDDNSKKNYCQRRSQIHCQGCGWNVRVLNLDVCQFVDFCQFKRIYVIQSFLKHKVINHELDLCKLKKKTNINVWDVLFHLPVNTVANWI